MTAKSKGFQQTPDLIINKIPVVINRGGYSDMDVLALSGLASFMETGNPSGLGDAMLAGWESIQMIVKNPPEKWYNPVARRLTLLGIELLQLVSIASLLLEKDERYIEANRASQQINGEVWITEEAEPTEIEMESTRLDAAEANERRRQLMQELLALDAELSAI